MRVSTLLAVYVQQERNYRFQARFFDIGRPG